MSFYYAKRAVEIFREEGSVELWKRSAKYGNRKIGFSKRNPNYFRFRNQLAKRLSGYSAIPDPYKIAYVSPDEITRYASEFGKWESVGLVTNGDWDKRATPIDNMMKYRAVQKHFQEGMTWERTGIIDYHCQRLAKLDKESVDGCSNRSEYRQWYEEIDQLYNNIKYNGYDENKHSSTNYVAIHIGRGGELLFAGSGCHRLSICKILDVEEIPVWIRARHEKWQKLRDDIYTNGFSEEYNEELRKHPDLQDIL